MIDDQPVIKVVSKGWGFEKIIANSEKYCGKLLYIIKGKKCSLHYHMLKDETFFVHSGKVRLFYSDNIKGLNEDIAIIMIDRFGSQDSLNSIVLNRGSNFYVPPYRVHQILALEDTELYEFSTQHFDSDSHRLIKGD